MSSRLESAARVRRFNRFYTRRMGLLNEGLLHSRFSLLEVRVMYELAHLSEPTARTIALSLSVDEGYLSRVLRGLRQRGLIIARAALGLGRPEGTLNLQRLTLSRITLVGSQAGTQEDCAAVLKLISERACSDAW